MNFTTLFTFLSELEANNSKERFDENRPEYLVLRKEFVDFFNSIVEKLQQTDPTLADVDQKSSFFRINRDVRFSKDKSPYKPYFSAVMSKQGGKKSPYVGWYLHLQPGNRTLFGCGMYSPDKDTTAAMRKKLVVSGAKFKRIVEDPMFIAMFGGLQGASLKRAPKGYQPDAQWIEYIKMKGRLAIKEFDDERILHNNGSLFIKDFIKCCEVAKPFRAFCNRAMDEYLLVE